VTSVDNKLTTFRRVGREVFTSAYRSREMNLTEIQGNTMLKYKKSSCRWNSWPYWLSVTFKVVQGWWLLFYLKGRMSLHISDPWPYLSLFRDMASFSLKNAHFFLPVPPGSLKPEFVNVSCAIDSCNNFPGYIRDKRRRPYYKLVCKYDWLKTKIKWLKLKQRN